MKRRTIEQLKKRKRSLLLRVRRDANELVDLDTEIEKMRTGKIKAPAPPGVKYTIAGQGYTKKREDWTDGLDDLMPVAPNPKG